MKEIAFLGLGAMGSRMTANLLKAGFSVTVWDRSPERSDALKQAGARVASTPKEAAEGAEVVISMVREDVASKYVWLDGSNGALLGMAPGSVAIESSTLSLEWIRDLAQQCTQRNIEFVDAPVLGSRPQAEAAQLIYLVGGADATVLRIQPLLQAMGGAVHRTGAIGTGAAMKLAANALFGIQVAAVAELLGILEAQGVTSERAAEILATTPLLSPAAKGAATQMLSGKHAPLFPIELVEKDLGYAVRGATGTSSEAPLIAASGEVFSAAISRGMGADNLTGVVQLYRHQWKT
jgi:3-hydroxyisobutyrate dehydrogenase-like beta-hydroxyacid dehydrogenase